MVLAAIALLIIALSTYYTSNLVSQFAQEERNQVRNWADAVERRASLMRYQEDFFVALRQQERQRVELLAKTYQKVLYGSLEEELTFYLEIISNNTSIPVIIVDKNENIIERQNVDKRFDGQSRFDGELKDSFSEYSPIPISDTKQLLYYKESIIFSELKRVLDDLVSSFLTDIASNASNVPVIITDSTLSNVLQYGNLEAPPANDSLFWQQQILLMKSENTPIEIQFLDYGKTFIFYKSSPMLLRIRYFPMVQIAVIGLFFLIAYLLFSYARRSEQNQVWVGMAKETAHQIGTPLSSLIAWVELLKMEAQPFAGVAEMEKDVSRLEMIAERFSKIGSTPVLESVDLVRLLEDTVQYLRPRTSKKIQYVFDFPLSEKVVLPLNEALFQWVIENLCKNAIDAMNGQGTITLALKTEAHSVIMDVNDTGRGMQKSAIKQVFEPGFTSKKRGWGLGLTLAKRIVKDYHKGQIFVKSSVVNEGTTIRIVLHKKA